MSKCKNCGADYAIHHHEANQCPWGGVEEVAYNRPQIWATTSFEKTVPDLLAVAESNLKILQGVYDTPTESGLLGILDYHILEQAIADTTAAIAAAKGEK